MSSLNYEPFCKFFHFPFPNHGDTGLILQGLRHKRRLTQKQMAGHLEVTLNKLRKMEGGEMRLDIMTAMKIEKVFSIPYKYLIDEEVKVYIGLPK